MSPRAESFPITVRVGSSAVKVYRDKKYFRVVYHLGGRRQRLHFASLNEAKTEAHAKAAQLARGDVDAAQLTGKDRPQCTGRALEAVRELGVSLDTAAIDYAQARRILEGHSLADAARLYMRHHGRGVAAKPVADAVAAFIEAKRAEGRSG